MRLRLFLMRYEAFFHPSAIKAVGYSDHQRRSGSQVGGRSVRNSVVTQKVTDEFCLFFINMTYVPGQFIPYIFFWHQANFICSTSRLIIGCQKDGWTGLWPSPWWYSPAITVIWLFTTTSRTNLQVISCTKHFSEVLKCSK